MIVISQPWLALAHRLAYIAGTILIDLGSLAFDDCIYSENRQKVSRKNVSHANRKKRKKKKKTARGTKNPQIGRMQLLLAYVLRLKAMDSLHLEIL